MPISEIFLQNILEEVCQNEELKKTCKKLEDKIDKNDMLETPAERKSYIEEKNKENQEVGYSKPPDTNEGVVNDSKNSLTKLRQKSIEKKAKRKAFRKFIKSMLENENEEELKLELKKALKNEEFQKYIQKLKNKYQTKSVSEEFGTNKSANSNRLKKQKNSKKPRLTPNDQELVKCYKKHKKLKSCLKKKKRSTLNTARRVDHPYLNRLATPCDRPDGENANKCFNGSAERFSRMLEEVKSKGSELLKRDLFERSFDSEINFDSLRTDSFAGSLSLKENSSIIINLRRMEMEKNLHEFKNNNKSDHCETPKQKPVKIESPCERPLCSDVKSQMANNSNRFSLPSRGRFDDACDLKNPFKTVLHAKNETLNRDFQHFFDKDFNFNITFGSGKKSCNKDSIFEKSVNTDKRFDICKKCGKRRDRMKSRGCAKSFNSTKGFNRLVKDFNNGDEWHVGERPDLNVNNCGCCCPCCDCCDGCDSCCCCNPCCCNPCCCNPCCCNPFCCCRCSPDPPVSKPKRMFRWRRCRQPCFLGEPCEVVADQNCSNNSYFNEYPEKSFFSNCDFPCMF